MTLNSFLKNNWKPILIAKLVTLYSLYRIVTDQTLFDSDLSTNEILIKILPTVIIICVVTYLLSKLSFEDLKELEISTTATYLLVILLGLINIILIAIEGTDYQVEIWKNNEFIPRINLLSGFLLGFFTAAAYLITQKKGLGEGDIFLMTITGFALGFHNFIFAFYVMIFSALIYGVAKGIHQGHISGQRIPMVPFISIAIILSFLFGGDLTEILRSALDI